MFFLYPVKWNFLALRLKNFLYFTTQTSKVFLEKNFLYFFWKKPTLKKFLIFWEMALCNLNFSYKKLFLCDCNDLVRKRTLNHLA